MQRSGREFSVGRFLIGGIAGLSLFLGSNYLSYLLNRCPETLDDCGWSFGFPLEFFTQDGFVSYSNVNGPGLFIDIVAAICICGVCGLIAERRLRRSGPRN